MKNIINDIKNNSIKPLYLLTGEEIYLMEHYLHELTNAVTGGEADDFNSMVVSREHTDEMSIYSFVELYPFMCDRKVLIIRNTGILKKATEEEKKYFPKLLESIPDYCVIIFYEPELDKRSAIYKAICKYGYVAEFPLQKGVALTNWVAKALKSYGKQMDSTNIEYLIASCNPGMINIKIELEKLVNYKKENPVITKSDIDILVNKSIESKVFDMAEDIVRGDVAKAQQKLDDMKKLNVKPVEILPAIFSKFSTYRKTKLLEHLPVAQIAIATKSRDFFVKKDLSLVKNVSRETFDSIVKLCQSADYKIKSGQSDGWLEISLIISSCKR